MNFLTRPITSEKLEQKGQKLYLTGKRLCFIGVCGLALLLLTLWIALSAFGVYGMLMLLTFTVDSFYTFSYLFLVASYLGILAGIIGIPLYLSGLNIFALGRIAHNTEKE